MIKFFGNWAQGIIVAVVISTVIELILPSGSSKKYVKSVVGVFILFTILSPVAKILSSKIDTNEIIEDYEKTIETAERNFEKKAENNSSRTVKDIYIANLKDDIKKKLEDKGYKVDTSVIKIKDDESYEIEKIKIYMSNKSNGEISVNTVIIGEKKSYKLDQEEQEKVKDYISENYGVSKENIEIM